MDHSKFVQITSCYDPTWGPDEEGAVILHALDERGEVWKHDDDFSHEGWFKLEES